MKSLVINMSLGTIERNEEVATGFGEEVSFAAWNPTIAALQPVADVKKKTMPAELAAVDAEMFLQKMEIWKR